MILLAFAAAWWLGWLARKAVCPAATPGTAGRAFDFFVSACLGLAVVSLAYYLRLRLYFLSPASLWILECSVAGILLAILAMRARRARETARETEALPPTHATRSVRIGGAMLATALALQAVVSALALLQLASSRPHGDADTLAVWNIEARFLFLGGARWTDVFQLEQGMGHPDYPLLLPAAIARTWSWVRSDTTLAPMVIGAAFTVSTACILFASLAVLRGRLVASAAACLLLSCATFTTFGSHQMADVPAGCFMLIAVASASLAFSSQTTHRSQRLALAGFAAGCAAWTKNEGTLFLTCALLASLLVTGSDPLRSARRDRARNARDLLLGAAAPLAVLVLFKTVDAPPNDIVNHFKASYALAQSISLDRHVRVIAALARDLWGFLGLGGFAVLAAWLALVGVSTSPETRRAAQWSALCIALHLAGIYFVYLTTPWPLETHLETSSSRVLLQVFPSMLFVAFSLSRVPGEPHARVSRAEQGWRVDSPSSFRAPLGASECTLTPRAPSQSPRSRSPRSPRAPRPTFSPSTFSSS